MSDLERLLRDELRERADALQPRTEWTNDLLLLSDPPHASRRASFAIALATVAAVVVLVVVGIVALRGDDAPQPAPPLPTTTPTAVATATGPAPTSPGRVEFLTSAGEEGDEVVYELAQEVGCVRRCVHSLWSRADGGTSHLYDFAPGQGVPAVSMSADHTHGIAITGPRTQVLRTDDGGRSWTVVDQEFATYAFPADVVFSGSSIYLYTVRWSGGPATDDDFPHLWRSSFTSQEWNQVELPATQSGFLFSAGPANQMLLATGRAEGDPLGWTYDGSTWTRTSTTLPCSQLSDWVTGPPAELYLWCPAEDGTVTLMRSTDSAEFATIGPPVAGPVGYPHLVGPFPVTDPAGKHAAVALVDGEGILLTTDEAATPVEAPEAMLGWTDVISAGLVAHADGTTYLRGTDGRVWFTSDGGITWSS